MIKSTTSIININKINIPANFAKTNPILKVAARLMCYMGTGTFDREIIVDEHYNLIDGYSTYLACKTLGLTKVRVLRIKVKFTELELAEMLAEQLRGVRLYA